MSALFLVAVLFVGFGAAARLGRDPADTSPDGCELCELEHRH